MKLIYIWIKKSKNGFIKGQGFNISGENEFYFDEEKKLLTAKKKSRYIKNFFGNSNIEELTAIVGENGTGKSTLLSEFMKCDVMIPHELREKETNKKIVVYEEENELYFKHNLGYEIFTPPILCQGNMSGVEKYTKIYVSNSMNSPVNASMYKGGDVLEYALTDSTIAEQARVVISENRIPDYIYPSEEEGTSRYYDAPEDHRMEKGYIDRIRKLNDTVNIDKDAYKNLNSIIRLCFLVRSKSKEYAGKKYEYITLKCRSEKDVFGEKIFEKAIFLQDSDDEKSLWSLIKKLKRKKRSPILDEMILFFLYEFCYYQEGYIEELKEASIGQIVTIRNIVSERIHRNVEESLDGNMTTDEYFINAADDLILLDDTINKNSIINSGWPEEDLGYYDALQVDLKRNEKFFERLFVFFDNKLPSIFFRYLKFEFAGLSSGEEALLNLYSRIFWIYNSQGCKRESLILIDEIDLYMHPRWQRDLIKYIVRDIPKLVGEKNKVQVVLSTHSPIILSDVPRQNVIFLCSQSGHCQVDDADRHKQTFGNNIHTLFLDSFFLNKQGTMGWFSEDKINTILSRLKSSERFNDNDENILKTIECIGDKLIRKRLLEIYEEKMGIDSESKYRNDNNGLQIVDNTIGILRKQIETIKNTIQELEKARDD